ncbi:ATP-binding protein [Chloroflexota bacterium]
MNAYAWVCLLSSGIGIFLASLVWARDSKSALNRVFVVFCLAATYWAFVDFGFRQSDTYETAADWLKVMSFRPFTLALLLHFSLVFTEQSRLLRNKWTYVVLYLPALAFSLLDLTTDLITDEASQASWGWTLNYSSNAVFYLAVLWASILVTLSIYLCLRCYMTTGDRQKKQQAKYVLIGLSVSAFVLLIVKLFLTFFDIRTPTLSTPAFVIGGIPIAYAIWKYRLFSLTPATASGSMLSAMSDLLCLVDQEARIASVNQAVLDVLGYRETELMGKDVGTIFAGEWEGEALFRHAVLLDQMTAQATKDIAMTIKTRDGRAIPASASVSVVRDQNGNVQGFVCIARDISERKGAEKALREAHDELEMRVEERTAELARVNEQLRQEMAERLRVAEIVQRKLEMEMTISRISSRFIGVSDMDEAINASLADMGGLSGADRTYLFLLHDDGLTVDNTHEWCAEGVIPQIENLQNLPADAIPWWMARLGSGDVIHIRDVSRMSEEAQAEKEILEAQGIKSLLVLPVSAGGNLAGFMGFDDVEETGEWSEDDLLFLRLCAESVGNALGRKQAEEELQQAYEEEKQLREQLELEAKRRVEFLRAMAHELKTPVTTMMASSELMALELPEGPLLSMAKNVNRGANNLNKRIDELLDLARGEMAMIKLYRQPMEPLRLLSRVFDDMSPLVVDQGHTLSTELPPSLPKIWADEDRLEQVLVNLISNANKYMHEPGKITIRARAEDENLVVEVHDTGSGIAREEHERMFDPYYRLIDDREHRHGLGLGLALSKTLVELHGGRIWVESEIGKGSTFGFSIPLATDELTEEDGVIEEE